MEPDPNTLPKQESGYPEGFENLPLEEKEKLTKQRQERVVNFTPPKGEITPPTPLTLSGELEKMEETIFDANQIEPKLHKELDIAGIQIEIVEALMNLAVYDESEKTLKVRQDADAEHVNRYIQDVVLPELENSEEITPPSPLLQQEGGLEENTEPQPKPEITPPTPLTLSGELDELEPTGAFGKEGESLKVGDTVFWDRTGSSGNGRIVSFKLTDGPEPKILVSVDVGSEGVVEIEAGDLVLVKPSELEEKQTSEVEHLSKEQIKQTLKEYDDAIKNKKNLEEVSTSELGWKKGEEWGKFEKLRNAVAQAEAKSKKEKREMVDVEKIGAKEYQEQKNAVAQKIKESLRAETGTDPLTPEQEAELNAKIHDTIFEELVEKENEAYLSALKEARGETKLDKAWEGAKSMLGNKAVKWYLGLGKKERVACSFLIGTTAGLAFGAGVGALGAVGYVGKRVFTGAAGIGMGELVNKKKSWSVEEIKRKEDAEVETLKNSGLSLEEQSKKLFEIQKRYKKERLKATAWKMGLTVAAGAGTSLLANLAEGAFASTGGVVRPITETQGGRGSELQGNKLPSRKGFEPPTQAKVQVVEPAPAVKPTVPEQVPKVAPSEPTTAPKPVVQETVVKKDVGPVAPKAEKLFDKPEVLVHEVKMGDSAWKILKETMENNEQFKEITEAQRTYILSSLTNKMLQSPADYGLGEEGALHIGDKTDFTKLFENEKEIGSIFKEAKDKIVGGRADTIMANNQKIADWVKENPEVKLTNDKVAEILATKPKTEATVDTETKIENKEIPEPLVSAEMESSTPILPEDVRVEDLPPPKPSATNPAQLLDEIAEAKKRIGVLEGGDKEGLRTMAGDTSLVQEVAKAFKTEIDAVYGQKGWLGMGKVSGVDTKEWGLMKGLPAGKVLEYFRNPENSDLPKKVLQELGTSEKHRNLVEQVTSLMDKAYEKSNADIKPFDNGENMETFIKRLGAFLMKQNKK